MLRSPLWVSRESQGLDSQKSWSMLKQCSSTASGNAQACRRLTVCGWCAGPMASMSRSCAAAFAGGGHRFNPSWQNWSLALAKRVERIAHCRGVRRNDLETLIISSHHPVSSQYSRPPLFSDVRTGDSSAYAQKLGSKPCK
jgi:hypothetical protein